jgi:hypothetical protein
MAYGMKIINQDNTVAYDSTSPGGVFVQFVTLPTNITTSSNIVNLSSAYSGMTIELFTLSSGDHSIYLVQGNIESGQNPKIIWDNTSSTTGSVRRPTILMVFAK